MTLDTFILINVAVLGLIFGSFATMLTYRIPHAIISDTSVFANYGSGRSKCPVCESNIPWYMLVPVLSWVFSAGKCSNCSSSIPARYPLIELSSMTFFILAFYLHGISISSLYLMVVFYVLLMITVIDFEHMLIPDVLSIPLISFGLLGSLTGISGVSLYDSVLGTVVGYAGLYFVYIMFKLIRKKEGMGFGDFKFFSATGALIGLPSLTEALLITSFSFLLFAVAMSVIKKENEAYPFGPFIALSTVLLIVFPQFSLINLVPH